MKSVLMNYIKKISHCNDVIHNIFILFSTLPLITGESAFLLPMIDDLGLFNDLELGDGDLDFASSSDDGDLDLFNVLVVLVFGTGEGDLDL